MVVHFDADLLVYRAGFAAEKTHYEILLPADDGEEDVVPQPSHAKVKAWLEEHNPAEYTVEKRRVPEPVQNALYNVDSIISTTLGKLGETEDDLILYLSGPTNFRNSVATILPYKGNRDPDHKPVHGKAIKEHMHANYRVSTSVNEEADDLIAYSHYRMFCEDPWSSVLVSSDKDLRMVPGLHYDFSKDEAFFISEKLGKFNFRKQLLSGDPTDNIPGIKNIGPKRAHTYLEQAGSPREQWDLIVEYYKRDYGDQWYESLVEVGRLLWMRRRPHEWWLPPKRIRPDE
ncbi:MAG: hypothetical protein QNJ97_17955 [Myxococcota bacterium]|nr:hypothetical protein [Myxococcota bacterium]